MCGNAYGNWWKPVVTRSKTAKEIPKIQTDNSK